MVKAVAAIRHVAFEDLGFFEAPLLRAGYAIRYYDAGKDDLRDLASDGSSLIVLLGGPMGVYEEGRYPFLTQELRILEGRIAARKPVLGVCLGAQLIARAMGARVYAGGVKEIGFAPVTLTGAGEQSPVATIPRGQPVLHWHGDTFDLPEHAELLASTPAYANQAFSVGRNVLALQFHLEAGREIERWLTGHAEELSSADIDPATIRAGALANAEALRSIADDSLTSWLSQVEE